MNQPERRKVSEEVRQGVLEALKANDYFIYPESRHYLEDVGFEPPEFVVTDLINYFQEGRPLYVLPENPAKCQCCLYYEDNLVIHVKFKPRRQHQAHFVTLSFHTHNTGNAPLPQ